ncbi:MAG: helix-turn-helix domain-containing protein [Lentisphaerae bacterium]|nr:helix-turn-helix domain-containing protein [Lentisphaerota bacterium]
MDIILFFQSTYHMSWRKKLSGVHTFAREHNWFVQVIDHYATTSEIRNAISQWNPIGCLVDRGNSFGAAPDIYFRDIPTVYLDQNPACPSLIHPMLLHDSAAEARLSGSILLEMNCRSYAYFGKGNALFWDKERFEQFRKDAYEQGHKVTLLSNANLREAITALPKPCGILAANDINAIKVFNTTVTSGFSIPDEVAIASIDNDEIYCESVSPGITSSEPDFEGAGYRLAAMLAAEIEKSRRKEKTPPSTEYYGPLRLVRRGSTMSSKTIGPQARKAVEYIRRHATERTILISDIAAIMKCSRRLATLRFREATGSSILEAIQNRRLEEICRLLQDTSLPISIIIQRCGYNSDSFVKRMFIKKTGMTMRRWRQENRPKFSPSI